ncbi:MAG: hypothetical protein VB142_11240 [Burkholderia sp.]
MSVIGENQAWGPPTILNGTQDDRKQTRTTSFMIDSIRRLDDITNADT